jgi:hypothetical protein
MCDPDGVVDRCNDESYRALTPMGSNKSSRLIFNQIIIMVGGRKIQIMLATVTWFIKTNPESTYNLMNEIP